MLVGTCVVVKIPQLIYVIDRKATYRVLCLYNLCLIVKNIIHEHLPILEKHMFLLLEQWKFLYELMTSLRKRQPVVEFLNLLRNVLLPKQM